MSGSLGEGIKIVGSMTAERGDGSPVKIAWVRFDEEPEDAATAYEVHEGGRLVPCDVGPLNQWRELAALAADMGG